VKIRAPLMIQDPDLAVVAIRKPVEEWRGIDEDHYLDGPVTPRVAVIDLDPDTEVLQPGAVFVAPRRNVKYGRYDVRTDDLYDDHFIQTSVFATVMRTVYMYEEPDTLGRTVEWAFDGPQLLVVPRAGWWPNAYYERKSRSLQFYSFRSRGKLVHTSLSRDIVAHETAHALIDGIVPDLYDAYDPQSLALHEGIADLTSVLIAFRSGRLRKAVLDDTQGSIEKSTRFSSIGVQFGRAIDPSGTVGWLRNLLDESKLDPDGDPASEPEPHVLSQVVTGALYKLMVDLHRDYKRRLADRRRESQFSVSGRALFGASEQFKRMILRGIDYLPPGEVTFADYGRAILAADQAAFPNDDEWRRYIRKEFVRRGIVKRASQLTVETSYDHEAVASIDRQALVDSQWVAYTFAERNRRLLRIPKDAQFEVLPRTVVTKRLRSFSAAVDRAAAVREDTSADDAEQVSKTAPPGTDGADLPTVKELLFKVRWTITEPNPPDLQSIAKERRVQTGTTLVIDWDGRRIRSLLGPLDLRARRPARDAMLRRLIDQGLLGVTTADAADAAKHTLGTGVEGVVTDDGLRIRGTGRLLHVARDAGRE
jgi:hypothetical protein